MSALGQKQTSIGAKLGMSDRNLWVYAFSENRLPLRSRFCKNVFPKKRPRRWKSRCLAASQRYVGSISTLHVATRRYVRRALEMAQDHDFSDEIGYRH